MAKHRGHGEGSIYQRSDGRWAASLTLENGKRKTLYGKTRKEVAEKLNKALQEQKQGLLATGPQQTVKHYLDHWLEDVHKPTLRVGSYVRYRFYLDKHILPALGHIQLQKLTPQHIQTFYSRKLKEGLSPKTIRLMHAILHKALANAVRMNLLSRNACDLVSPPRLTKHEIHPLTTEQAHQLLEAARGHRLEALLTVAVTTGMRRGELLGLRWSDVNFDEKTLHIRRTVNWYPGHGYVENEPKTSQSRRRIALPQLVIDVLKQHRINQSEARLKAAEAWRERDLIFCNTLGGFLDPAHLRVAFQNLLQEAGLHHVRFHDLRHSAATILLTMGAHPKVVQELLGHSQISITMDIYSHVLPSLQRQMMDRWDDLFGESEE